MTDTLAPRLGWFRSKTSRVARASQQPSRAFSSWGRLRPVWPLAALHLSPGWAGWLELGPDPAAPLQSAVFASMALQAEWQPQAEPGTWDMASLGAALLQLRQRSKSGTRHVVWALPDSLVQVFDLPPMPAQQTVTSTHTLRAVARSLPQLADWHWDLSATQGYAAIATRVQAWQALAESAGLEAVVIEPASAAWARAQQWHSQAPDNMAALTELALAQAADASPMPASASDPSSPEPWAVLVGLALRRYHPWGQAC